MPVMNFGSGRQKSIEGKRAGSCTSYEDSRNVLRFLPIWKSWMRNGFTPRKEFEKLYHEDTYEAFLTEYMRSSDYSELGYEHLLVYLCIVI